MAASPMWKVYNAGKEYRAACKGVEEAAVLVAFLGVGSTIRAEHTLILWTEGSEGQPAAESYDHVAEVVHGRLVAHRTAVTEKRARRTGELATTRHVSAHRFDTAEEMRAAGCICLTGSHGAWSPACPVHGSKEAPREPYRPHVATTYTDVVGEP